MQRIVTQAEMLAVVAAVVGDLRMKVQIDRVVQRGRRTS